MADRSSHAEVTSFTLIEVINKYKVAMSFRKLSCYYKRMKTMCGNRCKKLKIANDMHKVNKEIFYVK